MSGDAANAHLWVDADVYVSFDLNAATPADESTAFAAEWELVGLLDGDAGFAESREEDITDHFAWGGILFKTGRRNFKLQKKFTAFEDNAVTHRLRWPGSSAGELVVPRPERVMVAFEVREGAVTHRLISAYQAEIVPDGDVTENEADPASLAFVATIYPDTDGVLWIEQPDETGS